MNGASISSRSIHAVQFYEREAFLHRAVAEQLSEALRRGEPIVMIARPRTYDGVAERLAHREGRAACDVAGRIRFVDVDNALAELMDGARPNPARFDQALTDLIASVRKTNRCVTVEEGFPVCSIGNHLSAVLMEKAFDYLDAPVINCTGKDVPMPYAANLEKLALVTTAEVIAACKAVTYR